MHDKHRCQQHRNTKRRSAPSRISKRRRLPSRVAWATRKPQPSFAITVALLGCTHLATLTTRRSDLSAWPSRRWVPKSSATSVGNSLVRSSPRRAMDRVVELHPSPAWSGWPLPHHPPWPRVLLCARRNDHDDRQAPCWHRRDHGRHNRGPRADDRDRIPLSCVADEQSVSQAHRWRQASGAPRRAGADLRCHARSRRAVGAAGTLTVGMERFVPVDCS